MKIRMGFVSNSSSSCFIVAFDKNPKNHIELHNMLYGEKVVQIELDNYEHSLHNSMEISAFVFALMADQTCNDVKVLKEKLEGASDYDFKELKSVNMNNFKTIEGKTDWHMYDKEHKKQIDKLYKSFKGKLKNKFMYVFDFGNEVGTGLHANLEHSDVFDKVKYWKINHH